MAELPVKKCTFLGEIFIDFHGNIQSHIAMKKLNRTAFRIATLPTTASLVDVFKQINPNVNSEDDIQKCAKAVQKKIANRTKANKAKKKLQKKKQ